MEYRIERVDGTEIATLRGRLVFSDADGFRALLLALKGGQNRRWLVDFRLVEFIDSAGLGMLLLLRDEATASNASLTLRHPEGQVKKALELAKFGQLFKIEPQL